MLHDEQQRFSKDSSLSVIDSSGRQISLLNDNSFASASYEEYREPITTTPVASFSPPSSSSSSPDDRSQCSTNVEQQRTDSGPAVEQPKNNNKRKYHCMEPGCNKSFTTSGHLARHNRIHTGEKNFPCLFPGCQSRFSRQDNMMQHYRTHMSPKSRRTQRSSSSKVEEATRPRPRLHAHHRIQSDPYRVDPPLTIDQHLNNYHQSLGRRKRGASESELNNNNDRQAASSSSNNNKPEQPPPVTLFYQHRPLSPYNPSSAGQIPPFPFTLLHPPIIPQEKDDDNQDSSPEKDGNLMRFAQIVSSFG